MSIATLKKKVKTQYNNMSVGSHHGFSINGTTRNQGFVGQTMLSRSLPRTLCKGNVPKGHGGCCGTFPVHSIIQSGVNYLNNPNIVKPSVISYKGMIEMHNSCVPPSLCQHINVVNPSNNTEQPIVKGDYKYNIVKPDTNKNINTQQQYIDKISKEAKDMSGCIINIKESPPCNSNCKNKKSNYNKIQMNMLSNPEKIRLKTQSDYIERIQVKCTSNDTFINPRSTQGTPFGYTLKN